VLAALAADGLLAPPGQPQPEDFLDLDHSYLAVRHVPSLPPTGWRGPRGCVSASDHARAATQGGNPREKPALQGGNPREKPWDQRGESSRETRRSAVPRS
jgi:hypothetical protein